ncbi:hypothetical protein [Pseudoalteromonas arctica]|nr:hypothetical protein [Pseudoalteromonas arctica]
MFSFVGDVYETLLALLTIVASQYKDSVNNQLTRSDLLTVGTVK